MYISVKEYAEKAGVSERTVRRQIQRNELRAKEIPHPSRKDLVAYMIYMGSADTKNSADTPYDTCEPTADRVADTPCEPHYKTTTDLSSEACEPCEPTADIADTEKNADIADTADRSADTESQLFNNTEELPVVKESLITDEVLPPEKEAEAQLFAQFLIAAEGILDAATEKAAAWKEIAEAYNSQAMVPELYALKGSRSQRTIRTWMNKWLESGRDMYALIHQNAGANRGRMVTEFEQYYLLGVLLDGPKIPIGGAIAALKHDSRMGLCESPSSESTLKRWVSDWSRANPDQWAQARKGSKYVKDNIIKSIIRDTSMLDVGDVVVADGHVLAYDIINPETGKPCRMTQILIYDWASRYPIGAALALTESSDHILVAVRNAILHLGFLPKFIYLDNGKAFKSKLFHERWADHDLSAEFAGIFPRLGIQAQFAEAYNARTKVIERFFRTQQEGFERWQKTFRGRNIDDRPAQYSRNEKWAKKIQGGKPLLYDEALDLTYYYFRHVYGMKEHSGLKGKKPYEVFAARVAAPQRIISQGKLNYLMLKAERKKLRSEGIWLNKCRYWHESFVKHIGQPVIIRYDYSDLRWILVYDITGRFIAQAPMREAQHGFVALEMDNPIARQKLHRELNETRRLRRQVERETTATIRKAQANVAAVLSKTSHIKDTIIEEIKEENPTFRQPPMIQPPVEVETAHDVVSKLAAKVREQELEVGTESVISVTPAPSVSEELKRRGIL